METGALPAGAPVTVVGNLCWDVIVRGLPAVPAWGEEVEGDSSLQVPGGQGYNLSAGLATLGVDVALVGTVGADSVGGQLLAAVERLGVGTTAVSVHPRLPTAVTAALVRVDGERAFASDFGCQREFDGAAAQAALSSTAQPAIVCVAGIFNMPGLGLDDVRELLAAATASGAQTMLDTGWDTAGWTPDRRAALQRLLREVDWFLPNLDEARAITGLDSAEDAARALAEVVRGTVVVKCGSAGALALDRRDPHGRAWVRAGALAVEVRDAVGAGDTFDAGFIAGLLRGEDLAGAMQLASAAAGLRISRRAEDPEWPSWDDAAARARTILTTREPEEVTR